MGKYRGRNAKRADRPNPREDRNWDPTESVYENRKNYRKETTPVVTPPVKKNRVDIIPRNQAQEQLITSLTNPATWITLAVGPAGTGKTLLGTLHAIKSFKAGLVEKIVITRPNIAVDDKDIGYLPGDVNSKMSPWMMPVLDVFSDYFSASQIQSMMEEKILEMVPIAYIRGRTFKNAAIIFDEAQNSTTGSMLSVLTRIGEGSQMIITGDLKQSDRGTDNGLRDFINRLKLRPQSGVDLIEFGVGDVERHQVIKSLLNLYPDQDL